MNTKVRKDGDSYVKYHGLKCYGVTRIACGNFCIAYSVPIMYNTSNPLGIATSTVDESCSYARIVCFATA